MVTQLPVASRLQTAWRDEGGARGLPWAVTNYQLADVVDALNDVIYVLIASTGAKPQRPSRTPRPGGQRSNATTRERAELLLEMRNERRGDG